MFSYSDWLYERNERTDLPNFVVACVMLVLLVLLSFAFGFPAFRALAHGAGWGGTFTVGRPDQPVVNPAGPWAAGCAGAIIVSLAALLHVVYIVRQRGLDEV